MAMSFPHQIGSLPGTTAIAASESVSTSAAGWRSPVSTSAGWRSSTVRRHGEIDSRISPSPPLSPRFGGIRPDLSVACQALMEASQAAADVAAAVAVEEEEDAAAAMVKEYTEGLAGGFHIKGEGVPVFVMMPLDSVTTGNNVNRKKAMNASLQALKSAGVEGIMMDVWWGLVERESPGGYNWGGYVELFEMAKKHDLKIQAVMSFHQCGGNVGDSCTIPLPKWVMEEMDKDQDLAYTDQWGRRNYEYISLGCDTLPVLKGRTPVQCYADFMRAFRNQFHHLLGDTIVEIQVGMGPAGELRYPSYPEQNGTWKFPGIGAFQCYDNYMLKSLKAAAETSGRSEWGSTGPTDAGCYNNWPEDTDFFRKDGGGWNSQYGEFFLSWYSQMLLNHGDRILTSAKSIFDNNIKISVKVAGIHWHYGTRSHAPELTAGYYNTRFHDGYLPIAKMLSLHSAILNFTCIEMRDHEQPRDAQCSPEKLVQQVAFATREAQVGLAGENALQRYDEYAHEQIIGASGLDFDGKDVREMCAFTYLRMNPELFQADNWRRFVAFVKKMKEGGNGGKKCGEQFEREAAAAAAAGGGYFVHVTRPVVHEPIIHVALTHSSV